MNYFDSLHLGKNEKQIYSKFAEIKSNPEKMWYAVIEKDDKSFVSEYSSRFRSEAVQYFKSVAEHLGGQIKIVRAV